MQSILTTPFIQRVKDRLSAIEIERILDQSLTPAAVLLLLFQKEGHYHIIFNLRTQQVEHHKGEISFPGGVYDEGDENLMATALRENWEEMGIRKGDVTVLGELDDLQTRSNFRISPFVGTFPYPYEYKASPIEVAQVLEVPVDHLLESANQIHVVQGRGGESQMEHSYRYQDHVIWGATARILYQFLTLIS